MAAKTHRSHPKSAVGTVPWWQGDVGGVPVPAVPPCLAAPELSGCSLRPPRGLAPPGAGIFAAMQTPPGDPEGPPQDCVICFAPYDRLFKLPKALTCGHVFCLECLARVSVAAPAAPLLCPICRRPTPVPPRRGPPALPTRSDLLPPDLPAAPGSVRFDRPKGLLLYAPQPGQLPTVTLSLEVGGSQPPPAPPGGRSGVRWPLLRAVAVTIALMVAGGLVLGGVFLFFLPPAACDGGGSLVTNSTWGQPVWPPY